MQAELAAPRLPPEMQDRARVLNAKCAQLRLAVREMEAAWERDGSKGKVRWQGAWGWGVCMCRRGGHRGMGRKQLLNMCAAFCTPATSIAVLPRACALSLLDSQHHTPYEVGELSLAAHQHTRQATPQTRGSGVFG